MQCFFLLFLTFSITVWVISRGLWFQELCSSLCVGVGDKLDFAHIATTVIAFDACECIEGCQKSVEAKKIRCISCFLFVCLLLLFYPYQSMRCKMPHMHSPHINTVSRFYAPYHRLRFWRTRSLTHFILGAVKPTTAQVKFTRD